MKQKDELLAMSKYSPLKPTIKDQIEYNKYRNKNIDPYGNAIFEYAELWARLMEGEISQGKLLKDIVDHTSHLADIEGITGYMYGAAVSILSKYWVHGEELRKWHNGEYDYEGNGVINPAILTINI